MAGAKADWSKMEALIQPTFAEQGITNVSWSRVEPGTWMVYDVDRAHKNAKGQMACVAVVIPAHATRRGALLIIDNSAKTLAALLDQAGINVPKYYQGFEPLRAVTSNG